MPRIFNKYGKKDLDADLEADMLPAEMVDLIEPPPKTPSPLASIDWSKNGARR